jgi:hypothetical protein
LFTYSRKTGKIPFEVLTVVTAKCNYEQLLGFKKNFLNENIAFVIREK